MTSDKRPTEPRTNDIPTSDKRPTEPRTNVLTSLYKKDLKEEEELLDTEPGTKTTEPVSEIERHEAQVGADGDSDSSWPRKVDLILDELTKLRDDHIDGCILQNWQLMGIKFWCNRRGRVVEGFSEFVGEQITFDRSDNMHPKVKGESHLMKLEKTVTGVRKIVTYWELWQERSSQPGISCGAVTPEEQFIERQRARMLAQHNQIKGA